MAFDVITPIFIGQAALPADPTISTLYTVPAKSRVFLKDIDICNTTTGLLDAYVYIVKSGDSPTTANMLAPGITIRGRGMFQWSGVQILEVGDTIQGKGSLAGLTINISGGEAT